MQGPGCRVQGVECRVQGSGVWVQGIGFGGWGFASKAHLNHTLGHIIGPEVIRV
jgi:hypothetical protein